MYLEGKNTMEKTIQQFKQLKATVTQALPAI